MKLWKKLKHGLKEKIWYRMKFWQKLFVPILIVLFISIYLSMLIMMHLFSNIARNTEEDSTVRGAYISSAELYTDFLAFYRYGTLQTENKKRRFAQHSQSYANRNVYMQYCENDEVIFDNFLGDSDAINWDNAEEKSQYHTGNYKVLWFSDREQDYIAVKFNLESPFEDSSLVYIYSLQEYNARRSELLKSTMAIGTLSILFVCTVLFFIIHSVTKPLPRLSVMVKKIASGQYDEKLPVEGKDEIAVLSDNINDLSRIISGSIQELKTSAEEKQHFIDDLGHEIRTPLTAISGYAEYLNMATISEEDRKQSLDYIISESHRLEHLSATLLELASIREGDLERQNISAEHIVEYIKKIFIPRCEKAEVRLLTECTTDTIYTDEALIYMLITNLIENAIRASKSGSEIVLNIRNMREMGYKKTVITVKDEGIGMKPEDIDRIEEPFYRVDKARSRESGGVGLGVSLCRQIVRVHDGTMKYDSIVGKGTTVTVVLPEEDNVFELV